MPVAMAIRRNSGLGGLQMPRSWKKPPVWGVVFFSRFIGIVRDGFAVTADVIVRGHGVLMKRSPGLTGRKDVSRWR